MEIIYRHPGSVNKTSNAIFIDRLVQHHIPNVKSSLAFALQMNPDDPEDLTVHTTVNIKLDANDYTLNQSSIFRITGDDTMPADSMLIQMITISYNDAVKSLTNDNVIQNFRYDFGYEAQKVFIQPIKEIFENEVEVRILSKGI